jgi:hypothetical protein
MLLLNAIKEEDTANTIHYFQTMYRHHNYRYTSIELECLKMIYSVNNKFMCKIARVNNASAPEM